MKVHKVYAIKVPFILCSYFLTHTPLLLSFGKVGGLLLLKMIRVTWSAVPVAENTSVRPERPFCNLKGSKNAGDSWLNTSVLGQWS